MPRFDIYHARSQQLAPVGSLDRDDAVTALADHVASGATVAKRRANHAKIMREARKVGDGAQWGDWSARTVPAVTKSRFDIYTDDVQVATVEGTSAAYALADYLAATCGSEKAANRMRRDVLASVTLASGGTATMGRCSAVPVAGSSVEVPYTSDPAAAIEVDGSSMVSLSHGLVFTAPRGKTWNGDVPNPVVREAVTSEFPGWTIRLYLNGTYDARENNGIALSLGFDNLADLLEHMRTDVRLGAVRAVPAADMATVRMIIRELADDPTVTNAETMAVIAWCQDFARDCQWRDMDSEDIDAMRASVLVVDCNRHIEGGLSFVLADVRRLADECQHGYVDNCPDCDVPSHLEPVLEVVTPREADTGTYRATMHRVMSDKTRLTRFDLSTASLAMVLVAIEEHIAWASPDTEFSVSIRKLTSEAQCPHCGEQSPGCHCD